MWWLVCVGVVVDVSGEVVVVRVGERAASQEEGRSIIRRRMLVDS